MRRSLVCVLVCCLVATSIGTILSAANEEKPKTTEQTAADKDKDTSVANSFTDGKDGSVLDRTTGLTWQKDDSQKTMGNADAVAYGSGLRVGGHDDWRLPSYFELCCFYDNLSWKGEDHRNPVFAWGEGDWYWSKTRASELGVIGSAGGIGIKVGEGPIEAKSFKNKLAMASHPNAKHLVRCVRGRVSKEYISRWSQQLSDNDPAKRWEALLTLGFIEGPEAKEALPEIKRLLTDPETQIKERAKLIVEKIEAPKYIILFGHIMSISKETLVLAADKGKQPTQVTITKDTKFYDDDGRSEIAWHSLKEGDKVTVTCLNEPTMPAAKVRKGHYMEI